MNTINPLEIASLVISGMALGISGLAFFGTKATRKREWRIEVSALKADLQSSYSDMLVSWEHLQEQYDAFASADPETSKYIQKRIDDITRNLELLNNLPKLSEKTSEKELEKRMIHHQSVKLVMNTQLPTDEKLRASIKKKLYTASSR